MQFLASLGQAAPSAKLRRYVLYKNNKELIIKTKRAYTASHSSMKGQEIERENRFELIEQAT